jgi:hypothetical protein
MTSGSTDPAPGVSGLYCSRMHIVRRDAKRILRIGCTRTHGCSPLLHASGPRYDACSQYGAHHSYMHVVTNTHIRVTKNILLQHVITTFFRTCWKKFTTIQITNATNQCLCNTLKNEFNKRVMTQEVFSCKFIFNKKLPMVTKRTCGCSISHKQLQSEETHTCNKRRENLWQHFMFTFTE